MGTGPSCLGDRMTASLSPGSFCRLEPHAAAEEQSHAPGTAEAASQTLDRRGCRVSEALGLLRTERPRLPAVKNQGWAKNEVDCFILARLEKEGLKPSPEADRYTLLAGWPST